MTVALRGLAVIALWCAGAASAAQATEEVWDALRAPDSVVVVRHSYAPGAFDPPDAKLDDRDGALRQRLVAEINKVIAAHREGPPLVLVTHGSVVSDLTGLDLRMGAFVVLRRTADGTHAVAGQLYVE